MPMTEAGFRKYTYAEILEQQITRAKDLFGDDIDTSEQSVIGKYIRLNVSDFAQQEEALEALYQARYIDTAVGVSLDRLTPFAGIQRNAAVAAIWEVWFKNIGSDAVTIPMGTKLMSSNGVIYHTTQEVTAEAGESSDTIHMQCDTAGTIGNNPRNVRFYQTQIPNVQIGVNGFIAVVTGANRETDAELRKRWKSALNGSGSGTTNAIIGSVSRIDGVQDVVIYENETDTEMSVGTFSKIEPHSFLTVIKGAENLSAEIAKVIFENKPLGIQTNKSFVDSVTEQVTDIAGTTHEIHFAFAIDDPITVYVTISKANEPKFNKDAAQPLFEKALEAFFQDCKIGQTVYANALFAPLVQTGAVYCIDKIEVDFTNLAGEIASRKGARLDMGINEYAAFGGLEITYEE
ncbi:baseplate J/gp47 family protein [uncultured Ruminococcus sp.]|uniref:baseplate J/gp47 family protein n=1 Tax=uncultured Ruminococcus sp. TaxID=165186 RepID=UPI0025D81A66|nr:baseplate J/gp47 family protein [uncultured Ruminococcus sp.]